MTRIGVLALQGAFAEHRATLRKMNVETIEVRLPEQLETVDALIIPGGESTTIGKLMVTYGMLGPIRERARSGMPVLGTCAGMIALATDIEGYDQPRLSLLDVTIRRNAFGRQTDSFETELTIQDIGDGPFHGVFIRAPLISRMGPDVRALSTLPNGEVVAVRQDNIVATSFHPELTSDLRFHRYFLKSLEGRPEDN